jgi:hypothetical protein
LDWAFFDTLVFIFFFYERYKDVEEIELKEEKWIIISGIFFYVLSILLIRYLSFMIASSIATILENNFHLQKLLKSLNG